MHVFISYPREFKAVAEALDAALRSHRIDTFLDTGQVRPADQWQLEIESNIEKADIFVVLYSPEAAIKGRFFRIETELIKDASEKSLQRVITVIFNPTKPGDLPEFFRRCHIIQAETEGTKRDERDDYWVYPIVQELERLKARRKKLKQRQIIARSALALGAITIVLLSISLFNTRKALENNDDEEIQALQTKPLEGEKLCQSLLGNYTLHQNYIFAETAGKDARSTVTHATWKATDCFPNKRNGDFILKGEDDTDFDIEAIIDGKYERIATARFIYRSEVHIRKDGTLLGRSFDAALNPKTLKKFYKDERGNSFNIPESFIDQKIDEIIKLRNEKHRIIKTSPCVPIHGETDGKITVVFVCQGYTRTMVKTSESGPFDGPPGAKPLAVKIDEHYKVVLGADERLQLPGTPGELRVWIGSPDVNPRFPDRMDYTGSPTVNPRLPDRMSRTEVILPAIGKTAKVFPFAPSFQLEPKESICMEIHPSGSETRFMLTPTRTGTFNVGADVQLFNAADCRGTPVPKSTETLQVTVVVNKVNFIDVIMDMFREKLLEFLGLFITLFFGLLLFLIRGRLKKWFSFNDDK